MDETLAFALRGQYMKENRGKQAKYLVCAEKGLLKDSVWKRILKDYPTDLVCSIREQLLKKILGLTEKFNTNSRYFGYWTATGETDRVNRGHYSRRYRGLIQSLPANGHERTRRRQAVYGHSVKSSLS